jgi:hypothetical protein
MSVMKKMFGLAAVTMLCVTAAAATELERTGGPYVPTPQVVVDQMLRMANVGPQDFVVDLGSGDGVIVLTAARVHKARGYGVDIDDELVKLSNSAAKRFGIADRAAFHVQDVFKADLSKASVITLYLLPSMMSELRSKIFLETRPGTRVVSHDYTFGEWAPDDHVVLDVPEKEKVNGVPRATIHLWIVPAKVSGRWSLKVDGAETYDLTLNQIYQTLTGSAAARGKTMPVNVGALRGEEIQFTMNVGKSRQQFRGAVSGEAMQGTVSLGAGKTARWSARKL